MLYFSQRNISFVKELLTEEYIDFIDHQKSVLRNYTSSLYVGLVIMKDSFKHKISYLTILIDKSLTNLIESAIEYLVCHTKLLK